MNEREEFVREIRANPDDITPRLVFADYLEMAGDLRGKLIRVQCQLSTLDRDHPKYRQLEGLESELLTKHSDRWLAPLREYGAEGVSTRCFRFGLAERLRIDAGKLIENLDALIDLEPALNTVDIRIRDRNDILGLAELELPPQIVRMDLSANRLEPSEVTTLSTAPWVPQLRELNLQFNRLEDDGIRGLTSVSWQSLTRLFLGSNKIGPAAMESLSTWSSLGRLKVLKLNSNRLGGPGLSKLVASDELGGMEELDLASNQIDSNGVVDLARASSLKSLKRLILRSNLISGPGYAALRFAGNLDGLEVLDLRSNSATVGRYGYGRDDDELPKELGALAKRFGDILLI